jgi:hypothetical protein
MQSACAVLYCHLWSVWLYHVFPHYLKNSTIFGKKLLNIKCVFLYSLQLLSETFLSLKRIQRDIIINVHRSSCKVPLFLTDFNQNSLSPKPTVMAPPGHLNPYHPIRSATVLTELPRLFHNKEWNPISAVYFDNIPGERRVF